MTLNNGLKVHDVHTDDPGLLRGRIEGYGHYTEWDKETGRIVFAHRYDAGFDYTQSESSFDIKVAP